MRATAFAMAIGCLSIACPTTGAMSAPQKHHVTNSSTDKAEKDRQQQKAASEPKGFSSICIGCGAK